MPTTQIRGGSAGNSQIKAGTLSNVDVASGAAIALTKLAGGTLILLADGTVTMTAPLNAGTFRFINLGEPTGAQDAVTKNYVDNLVSGLKGKASVRASSTANLTLSATQTVDGVALAINERVLVKDQTTSSQNGIYIVQSGAWTRATDTDSWIELVSALVFVEEGSSNADKSYLSTVNQGGTLGTTTVTFVQFGSGGGLATSNFVTRETPSGLLNGTNTTFGLAFTPVTGSELIFLNGILQQVGAGNDYTISGTTITMLSAPISTDTLLVGLYLK
jgi:hypothetical protein